MIICPNCAAENRDEAAVCYFCGRDLAGAAERANPTQPVRVRPADPPPYDTQPVNPPPGGYPPPGAQPYPPPDATQPGGQSYYTQPYTPGQTGGAQVYNPNAQTYPGSAAPVQPGYPPPPQAAPKKNLERFWPLLIGSLLVVFLCAGAMVVWTFTALLGGGSTQFGRDVSTQVAEIVPLPADETATAVPEDPTPWPTFTPLPTYTPYPTSTPEPSPTPVPPTPIPPTEAPPAQVTLVTEPTQAPSGGDTQPTLNPTQVVDLEKLLSPECSTALDTLSELGNQVTTRPTAPFDANWRQSLTQAIDQVNTHCGSLDEASPVPGIVAEAQSELSLATAAFDTAGRLFNEGVREWNLGKILDAGRYAREATGHLNNAIAALGKINR